MGKPKLCMVLIPIKVGFPSKNGWIRRISSFSDPPTNLQYSRSMDIFVNLWSLITPKILILGEKLFIRIIFSFLCSTRSCLPLGVLEECFFRFFSRIFSYHWTFFFQYILGKTDLFPPFRPIQGFTIGILECKNTS